MMMFYGTMYGNEVSLYNCKTIGTTDCATLYILELMTMFHGTMYDREDSLYN